MPLRLIGPDDPALAVLQSVLQRHPEWDTTLTIVPWPEYQGRLTEILNAPESPYQGVCVPGHVWVPQLAAAGHLAPLDSLLPAVPTAVWEGYQAEDLLPLVDRERRYQGQVYMLPLFSDGHILFYRKDLISLPTPASEGAEGASGAGVAVISPLDLADLAAGLRLPPGVHALALKAHPSEIFLDWLPFLWAAGGELLDAEGHPAFAGPAGVRALEAYCDLRRFCPPETHTFGNGEIAQVLREGRVALATTWGGQAAPIWLDPESRAADLYGTAVFPRPWNGTWGVGLPANQLREVQEATLAVLLQATGPEQDREVTRVAGSPVRQSSYTAAELERYPWLPAQLAMLQRAGMLPTDPRFAEAMGALYEAVYAAFTGTATPREALTRAESAVREALGG